MTCRSPVVGFVWNKVSFVIMYSLMNQSLNVRPSTSAPEWLKIYCEREITKIAVGFVS